MLALFVTFIFGEDYYNREDYTECALMISNFKAREHLYKDHFELGEYGLAAAQILGRDQTPVRVCAYHYKGSWEVELE